MNEQNKQEEYIYSDFQQGIADSPEDGFQEIRNCNVERYPGAITPGWQTLSTTPNVFTSKTITYSGGNILSVDFGTATPYVGQAVSFSNTAGGITAGTIYYISTSLVFISGTTWQFGIAANPIDAFAGGGSGNITLSATPTGTVSSFNMGTVVDIKTYYPTLIGLTTEGNTPRSFLIDSNGRVWAQLNSGFAGGISALTQANWIYLARSNDGSTGTASQSLNLFTGSDAKVWLIVTNLNVIDVIEVDNMVISAAGFIPTWTIHFTSGTANLSQSIYHQSLITPVPVTTSFGFYVTDGHFIFSVFEAIGKNFDPTDATTFVVNAKALVLPTGETAQCMEFLGLNLLVGGKNTNIIYQWDNISVGYSTLFGGERNIWRMKNIANVVYILAGVKGIIYYTTGYSIIPLKKIPESITGGSITWGGMEKINGNLLFGFVGANGDASGNTLGGVGKLYITEQAYTTTVIPQGSLFIDQTPVSGVTTLPTALNTYKLVPYDLYYIGSSTGIDVVDISTARKDGSSYVICKLEHASPVNSSRTFSMVGIELLLPLGFNGNANDSVDVQYRTNLGGTFTDLYNFSYGAPNNNGNILNDFQAGSIDNVNIMQAKVILTSGSGQRQPLLSNVQIK